MSQPVSRKNKGKAPQRRKVSVHFEEFQESTIAEPSPGESGCEIEDWESDLDAPVDRDSSPASAIMAATPCLEGYNLPTCPKLLSDVVMYLLLLLKEALDLLCIM